MHSDLTLPREILCLVHQAAGPGASDPLGGKERAFLAQAALWQFGVGSTVLCAQVHAMCLDSINFTLDVQILEINLTRGGKVRMNMHGDIDDAVVPGIIREWEASCHAPWPGKPSEPRWFVLPPVQACGDRSGDYFNLRASALIANARAAALSTMTPPAVGVSQVAPRL